MGGSPKVPAPQPTDIEGDITKFVSGYSKALPDVLTAEKQFRPEFQNLNLQDISRFLGGDGGQQGLFGLSRLATGESASQLDAARAAELGSMAGQAPLTRGLMESLSPEQAAAVRAANVEAERARASAQGVSPQEKRAYEQLAREGFQSSGRLGGNLGIVSEAMGREDVLARKRLEAMGARESAYNMAQGFYTQPGLALLGQQPLSYQTGQNMLSLGMGGVKQGTPGLINPDAGLNLGAVDRQNAQEAAMANAQAKAAKKNATMAAVGTIAALMISDKRLKKDIKKVGKTESGLPIYTYKYKGEDTTQMGVMAQDVEKKTPKAVRDVGGFKAVDYSLVK